MIHLVTIAVATLALARPDAGDFELRESGGAAKGAHGAKPSKIVATRTEAAMKLFVVDKTKGPIKGVVICLTAPSGTKYCTEETDADGYAEVLVPVGQKYEITYLSLGRRGDVAANVTVSNDPKQSIKLTLRYTRQPPPPPFVLTGVNFDTGKATIRPESTTLLDVVVEFMRLKKSARIEISGHTDNVGNAKSNKLLSERRAQACRAYLIGKGIDGGRITAVGFGAEKPVVPNDSPENREKNRRIQVVELQSESAG